MIDVLLFWLEVAVIVVVTGTVFLAGVFIILVEREKQYQATHTRELAQARLAFEQPDWEMVEDAPFGWGKPKYETLSRYLAKWMGWLLDIPERYPTDGASVPRPLWSFTGYLPDGKHRAAALVHDFLCDKQFWWCNWLDAADCFAHYQRLARVRPAKIVATYWAVVIFGPKWLRKEQPGTPRS